MIVKHQGQEIEFQPRTDVEQRAVEIILDGLRPKEDYYPASRSRPLGPAPSKASSS